MEKRRGSGRRHDRRCRWLLGCWGHRRPCLMFAPRPRIPFKIEFCPPCSLNPQGFDLDPLPGRAGDRLPSPKKAPSSEQAPAPGMGRRRRPGAPPQRGSRPRGLCRGSPPGRRRRRRAAASSRVRRRRRCRRCARRARSPFPLGGGRLRGRLRGSGGGSGGGSGFGIRVDLLGDGVVEGAEVHRVGRLPSKVVLHQPKHRKVEGLGEV